MDRVPTLRRVLVVFKTTKLDRYRDALAFADGLEDSDGDVEAVYDRLRSSHDQHLKTVAEVEGLIERSGLKVVRAAQLCKRDAAAVDLVVSVGGDGTLLHCARKVERTPILGVNSAPGTSTGRYCAATKETLEAALAAIRQGTMERVGLTRIALEIRGRKLPYPALNDVLFCHRSPAAATHYLLRVDDNAEFQVSSGLWVATASGSTGGILSAGGEVVTEDDGRFQFRVREPYVRPGGPVLSMTRGFCEGLKLVSRSPANAVFLDGHDVTYQVGLGETLVLRPASNPLWVYGFSRIAE